MKPQMNTDRHRLNHNYLPRRSKGLPGRMPLEWQRIINKICVYLCSSVVKKNEKRQPPLISDKHDFNEIEAKPT